MGQGLLDLQRYSNNEPATGEDFVDWWQLSCHSVHTSVRKGTSSAIMLVAWCIWKNRNAIIFDNAQLSLARLLDTIKTEARHWATAGARGLAALLPVMAASSV